MAMLKISDTVLFTDANLKAYYKLDNGALTTDSGPDGVTLTNYNTVAEGTGQFDGAADFGTTNTNKTLRSTNELGVGIGDFSMMGLVKIRTEVPAVTNYRLFGQSSSTNKTSFIIEYNGFTTKNLGAVRVASGIRYDVGRYNVTLGTTNWSWVVLTYKQSTKNLLLYLDGTEVIDHTTQEDSGSGTTTGGIFMGAGYDGTTLGEYAPILLDEVAYFDRLITPTEVTAHWAGTDTPKAGFLVMF